MNTEIISVEQKSLASRSSGSEIRSRILTSIENGNKVILDIKNAEFVSGSFADELFGVLIEWKGLDWFKENIKVLMTEPLVKTKILESIEYRQSLSQKKIAQSLNSGKVTAEIVQAFAENEFEKYGVIQDRILESDIDREIKKRLGDRI